MTIFSTFAKLKLVIFRMRTQRTKEILGFEPRNFYRLLCVYVYDVNIKFCCAKYFIIVIALLDKKCSFYKNLLIYATLVF